MRTLRERWRTGAVAVALVLMVVGWLLPWSSNAILGDGSSSDVLFGEDAVGVATQAMLIALPLLLVAGLWRVRWSATLGVVAAAVLSLALVAHRAHLSDQQVNAIGATASGEMYEEWATTTAGLGLVLWLVASGLLLAVTGADLIASLRGRRTRPSPPDAAIMAR